MKLEKIKYIVKKPIFFPLFIFVVGLSVFTTVAIVNTDFALLKKKEENKDELQLGGEPLEDIKGVQEVVSPSATETLTPTKKPATPTPKPTNTPTSTPTTTQTPTPTSDPTNTPTSTTTNTPSPSPTEPQSDETTTSTSTPTPTTGGE
jgi:outer membrane biosynthesis protein TonB